MDFVVCGNGGGEVVFGDVVIFVGKEWVEEKDGLVGVDFVEGGGFGEVGDGEEIGVGVYEVGGGLWEVVVVGIGFDDGDVVYVVWE